jgi:hypothetical protein
MLAMLPRLKTAPPHQISSYLTLTKKRISNVFVKGIFGYLLTTPLRIDTYTRNVLDMDCQTQGRLKLMIELYISEICHKFQ